MDAATLKNTFHLLNIDQIIDFNLADLVIDGQRVFKMGNCPRNMMPQLKGFPVRGSVAEYLPKDTKGKVDVTDLFLNWLANLKNVEIQSDITMSPRFMYGSQSELVASKVAKHTLKMLDDSKHKKFKHVYLISGDNIVIDGHHGWASARCWELIAESEVRLHCTRIRLNAGRILDLAREFTSVIGVEAKEGL